MCSVSSPFSLFFVAYNVHWTGNRQKKTLYVLVLEFLCAVYPPTLPVYVFGEVSPPSPYAVIYIFVLYVFLSLRPFSSGMCAPPLAWQFSLAQLVSPSVALPAQLVFS